MANASHWPVAGQSEPAESFSFSSHLHSAGRRTIVETMESHPHADAAYRVISRAGGALGSRPWANCPHQAHTRAAGRALAIPGAPEAGIAKAKREGRYKGRVPTARRQSA